MMLTLFLSGLIGLPSLSTPWFIAVNPLAVASYVMVKLFGAGPGTYFDLAGFIFHVPTTAALLCADTSANTPIRHIANAIETPRTTTLTDLIAPLPFRLPGWERAESCTGWLG